MTASVGNGRTCLLDPSVLAGGGLVIAGVILTQRSTMNQLKEAGA
ncbi:MAG: hypothetical protein Q8L93_03705 [Rhodocyclaceae bacterium]|nr:hypothetical protein [Rhodocyclaceae bacterium]